jgi:hypothetical protein
VPRSFSQANRAYPVGTYGPFVVNNLDPEDSVAYLDTRGDWQGSRLRVLLEMRVGNGPWFVLCADTFTMSGVFIDKYTGLEVVDSGPRVSLAGVGELQRDLRATLEVIGAAITAPVAVGTR